MNAAFQEALAARLLWLDVVVLENIEGCEAQTEAALQAAFDAVHELASNDVLTYRHYGPKAPLLLQDVPELADQYSLAHELYSELYFTNYHNGSLGKLPASWQTPAAPLALPYSQWLAAVTVKLAAMMEVPGCAVAEATKGQTKTLLITWSQGLSVEDAAEAVHEVYECDLIEATIAKEFEAEEAHRRYCEDIADTYASIEADLWAGWRKDCADEDMAA